MTQPKAVIEALFRYPVKSFAGQAITSSKLLTTGLQGDREWMLVDQNGHFLTQRQHPLLACIKVIEEPENSLTLLIANGSDSISFTIDQCTESIEVKIWKDICQARKAPHEINLWLEQRIGTEGIALVGFNKAYERARKPERFAEHTTYFADAAPFLITNTSSLDALNKVRVDLGEHTMEMSRFRPNIVLGGDLSEFAEHGINKLIRLDNKVVFQMVDHSQRCSVITVDQTRGIRDARPNVLKQLAALNPMPNKPKAPAFGVNATLLKGAGESIRVGDTFLATF